MISCNPLEILKKFEQHSSYKQTHYVSGKTHHLSFRICPSNKNVFRMRLVYVLLYDLDFATGKRNPSQQTIFHRSYTRRKIISDLFIALEPSTISISLSLVIAAGIIRIVDFCNSDSDLQFCSFFALLL